MHRVVGGRPRLSPLMQTEGLDEGLGPSQRGIDSYHVNVFGQLHERLIGAPSCLDGDADTVAPDREDGDARADRVRSKVDSEHLRPGPDRYPLRSRLAG